MQASVSRVTIVVRTRNRAGFLERAIRDVLAQTFTAWRIVIANDGGNRSEVDAVVATFAAELGERILVIDVEAPHGRCAAANQGIRADDAEFVVLHDDDDRWHVDFLATTTAWLDAHPEDAGVMVPTEIVYERERSGIYVETGRVPFWPGLTQITFHDLLEVNRAVPISFLYRRMLHDRVGFYDEQLEAVEDWEFYLRVTLDHRIGFAAGPALAYWSQRPADRGDAGNSMFALGDVHRRFDTVVRDRALRTHVREHGIGLPLYVAGLHDRISRLQDDLARLERWTLRGIARRVRRRIGGGRTGA